MHRFNRDKSALLSESPLDPPDSPKSLFPTTMEIDSTVKRVRETFRSGKTKDVKFRRQQLDALMRLYEENQEEIVNALAADLRRPRQEAVIFEINVMMNDLLSLIHNFDEWTSPERPSKGIANLFDDVLVYKEPYGVVLIIGPWNYPIMLCMVPLAGAIAAGNCVIIKPSEISTHSAKFIANVIPKYLDNDCYKVICGGIDETTSLLTHQFDYIFYTGSSRVGQIVHAAANKYLTPVTLELGGKSPCYIDDSVDIPRTVRRVMWGKFCNTGQTCIAPDYILCTKEVERKIVEEFKIVIKEFYGDDAQQSPDYGRMATDAGFKRVVGFLNSGKIAAGGKTDPTDRYIEPTLLVDVTHNDHAMQEEIFGPVLPIYNIRDVFEAIDFINERDKPLSMYIFTNNKKDKDLMIDGTSAGTVCVNDTVQHFASNIPFGGVGMSGMGAYHGKYTFDTFSHRKGCLDKSLGYVVEKLCDAKYPPYTDGKTSYLSFMMKTRKFLKISYPTICSFVFYLVTFGLGFGASYWYQQNYR